MPVTVFTDYNTTDQETNNHRAKRSIVPKRSDPSYIDDGNNQFAGGVPLIKMLIDSITSIIITKNYNYTRDGFEAVHEQLQASSLMSFQSRFAVDMLLAEKCGICSIFYHQCCSFIPNNKDVFSSVLILYGCCCIPCIRALIVCLIDTALSTKFPNFCTADYLPPPFLEKTSRSMFPILMSPFLLILIMRMTILSVKLFCFAGAWWRSW